MNIWFTIGWIVIVVAGLALEAVALMRPQKGDTASEHVWWLLRRSPVIWFLTAGLLVWVLIHFLGFGIVDGWLP